MARAHVRRSRSGDNDYDHNSYQPSGKLPRQSTIFTAKDYECAITLAGAAEGQIKEKSSNHLFRLIRAKFSKDRSNLFINWMKHSSGPDKAEISEQSVW